jgi:hypothetical protein
LQGGRERQLAWADSGSVGIVCHAGLRAAPGQARCRAGPGALGTEWGAWAGLVDRRASLHRLPRIYLDGEGHQGAGAAHLSSACVRAAARCAWRRIGTAHACNGSDGRARAWMRIRAGSSPPCAPRDAFRPRPTIIPSCRYTARTLPPESAPRGMNALKQTRTTRAHGRTRDVCE